ncbi:hypothetical protein DBZ36_18385 [Alginatibacterium sediminis]|uniref:Uncharacterized protein n=1 Tax=Alginatibacterium sediminis TaxID=2164068 RepID=A0A420E6Q3_9ALTE|nr:hypothetical protein [Alginatibacterium sediminis]RKF13740.1 hypothetical protein DBZ36_18385 [Alginatibacterium sediminis]
MSVLSQIYQVLHQSNQFDLNQTQDLSSQLCMAWLIANTEKHPQEQQAAALLVAHKEHPVLRLCIHTEPLMSDECSNLSELPCSENPLWSLFSPEALECKQQASATKTKIRKQRSLTNISLDGAAITDVAQQVLLTSNVLLSLPLDGDDVSHIDLGVDFHTQLQEAQHQSQQYWYDHPIPIGISPAENEILYGLKHLDAALDIERHRGNLAPAQKLNVALSCSVTHSKLSSIAKAYVEYEIRTHLQLKNLQIYVFAEQECEAIKAAVFPNASHDLKQVFGVNGAYGRHYSFLKAIAALCQKYLHPKLRATFKIDLDQVFDQPLLLQYSGKSAFEHLLSSNWGANALDASGQSVSLGMIAGGLVNEKDVRHGLFTPDVRAPNGRDYLTFEQLFCARWSQALSTEVEVVNQCSDIQRIHVTGGTNGILIDALYRFRPFTPDFIHRAEDQALFLSALAQPDNGQYLVYAHQPGLIMRHDKDAFADRAMQVAEDGKALGDIERILLFSCYAKHHPMSIDELKDKLYPFTGVFIAERPITLAILRFLLEGIEKNQNYLDQGAERLFKCIDFCHNSLKQQLDSNTRAWDEYYSSLAIIKLDPLVTQVLNNCQLKLESTCQ